MHSGFRCWTVRFAKDADTIRRCSEGVNNVVGGADAVLRFGSAVKYQREG